MRYFLVIRTPPGQIFTHDELQSLREEIRERTGIADVHKLNGPEDADIDADTLSDLIAKGRLAESEFAAFCDSIHTPMRRPDGEYDHIASQMFLDRKHGQEIMSFTLPTDDTARAMYAAVVSFSREHGFRLWCPMPDIQGDLDLTAPGLLPPKWNRYVT